MDDLNRGARRTRFDAQPRSNVPVAAEEVRLIDLWCVVVRQRCLILVVIGITTLAALLIALTTAPVYRSEVLVAPVGEGGGSGLSALAGRLGGVAQLAGIDLGASAGPSPADEAIAILRSRSFTERFIREENLLPILFPERWNPSTGTWKEPEISILQRFIQLVGLAPSADPEQRDNAKPSMWEAYKVFDEIRSVSRDRETGLITVAVEWTDPQLAADWANKLVAALNAENRARRIAKSQANLAYLNDRLGSTSIQSLREVLYRLIEAETRTIMLANSQEEFSFRVLDPAVVPEAKVRPRRTFLVAGGLFIGLILGIFAAFIRNLIQQQRDRDLAT